MQDEKLKITIEALLEVRKLALEGSGSIDRIRRSVQDALREIQNEHYLGEPSSIVAEVIGGKHI